MKVLTVSALCLVFCGVSYAQKLRAFAPETCLEGIPRPPVNLKGRAVNDTAITVTWQTPDGNVCIDTYDYYVVKKGDPQPRTVRPRSRTSYSITIANLKRDTEYVVYVASVNSVKGASKYATVNVRTRRDRCPVISFRKPGAVSDVNFVQSSKTNAQISWLPPAEGSCAWYYWVDAYDTRGKRLSRRVSFDADYTAVVKPNTKYEYRITPHNLLAGDGPTTRATLTTMGPRMPPPGGAGRKLMRAAAE